MEFDQIQVDSLFGELLDCHSHPFQKKLVLIEVQSGSYLGEDDIIRFEDKYNR